MGLALHTLGRILKYFITALIIITTDITGTGNPIVINVCEIK
jgi:hypothetical protein